MINNNDNNDNNNNNNNKFFKMKIEHLILKIPIVFSSLFRVIWTILSKY